MIWLASFPRSGNTFFRNVMFELYGLESYDYYPLRGVKVRKDYTSFHIVKTHLLPWQIQPQDSNIPAIYLVRDGRDAIVSMAHQRKDIIAPGSDFQENLKMAIVAEYGGYFGGWSENCRQWIERSDIIIRYEDLISDSKATFERVRKLMNLPEPDYSKIPTFEQLKFGRPQYGNGTEELLGGADIEDYSKKFYRKGKAGGWRDDMSVEIHDLFWSYHGEMMEHLGYSYNGEIAPLHQDTDRMIISKLDLPLQENTHKTKVLIESSKLLLWYNEGAKRYLMELLKGMLEVVQAPKSNWEIDIYVGGKIYSLESCARFFYKDALLEKHLMEYRSLVTSGISKDEIAYQIRGSKFYRKLKVSIRKLSGLLKRSSLYQLYFHTAYFIKKYPFRFKINTYWNQGRRKYGLKSKIKDLSQYDVIHLPVMQNYKAFKDIPGNYVITMHDLTHIYFPQFHTQRNIDCCNEAMKFIADKEAEIIAISESTKHDYLKETKAANNLTQVIYEAADRKKFRQQTNKDKIRSTLDNYKIPDAPYLLCLSTLEPRKNLVNTIKAFKQFTDKHPDSNLNLVVAGKNGWKNDELFTLDIRNNPRIAFTGFVADEDLPNLYSGALALSYVSYYEGFGLPPLEAMSCRTPVIFGNNSSMIEVVGDTGYKADPANVNSILAQMECVYFDKVLREEKASLALQKSFTFSWRKTVIETLNLYSKVSGVKKTDSVVSEIKLAGVE